jgi:hypothetical protein
MKALVNNYSSFSTTEPLYFNTALNTVQCESTLWPNGVSTFDIFDMVRPDIHITHHKYISNDLIIYLKDTQSKPEIIINITGLNQDQLNRFESFFVENNIVPALYFVNHYDHNLVSKKTNIISLLHGADVFLGSKDPFYDIDYGIIIQSKEQAKSIGDTYHFITYDDKCSQSADLFFSIDQLASMYTNYKNIVFRFFNGIIPQAFFDACIRNNNVFFDIENREILDNHLIKIFGEDGACNMQNKNRYNIVEKIKQKHTCLHRTKSLLSQLPCKEYTDRLQTLIEGSIK